MTGRYAQSIFLVILCLGVSVLFFGCSGPKRGPVVRGDRSFSEAMSAARSAYGQDRIDQAENLYEVALRRARAMDKPEAIGKAAYNLAACLLRLGQYERARLLLVEASHELGREGSGISDVLILQARAAHLAGDEAEARAFVQQVREDSRAQLSAVHMSQAAILEGQIACDKEDWELARSRLREAADLLALETDSLLDAQLAGLKARIAMGKHEFRSAAESWERQADLLRDAHQYRALSSVLAQAGEARLELGEHRLAADQLYRAARNAASWGEKTSARKWAQAALEAGRKAEDAVIVELAESLLSEFGEDQP